MSIIGIFLFSAVVLPSFAVFTQEAMAAELSPAEKAALAAAKADSSWAVAIGNYVGNLILMLASGFTWLGGKLLAISVKELVLQMGAHINGSPGSPGIGTTINSLWATIRDICNLAFIFGFIFVGIRTILDYDNANTKRVLASIIIGALLINFSLFFTKIVIDFSNFTAIQIHNAMFDPSLSVNDREISKVIMDQLGIVSLYGSPDPMKFANLTTGGNITFYFMGAIFLIIAGFVLAAGAILLVIRYVALIFIMIFSPLLFAATVFPQTKKYADGLLTKLLSYSFFAPVFIFLIFVSLKVIAGSSMLLNPTGSSFSDALQPNSIESFGVILNFLIAAFFLMMSVQLAQKLGMVGATTVINNTKKAAGAATSGMSAAAGRATIGRYAHKISTDKNLLDRQGKKGVGGFIARSKLAASRVVADTSFDARKVGGAGKSLGIGEGRKGGYKTTLKELEEKETKFAKSLGEIDDDDFNVKKYKKSKESAEAKIKALREERGSLGKDAASIKRKNEIPSEIRAQEKIVKDSQRDYAREKQRRVLGSARSSKEIEKAIENSKSDWKKEQENLNASWEAYNKMTDELEKEVAEKAIKGLEKQVADAKKRYEEERSQISSDEGYAKVLEDSGFITSWIKGRLVDQEKEAGKSIRKAFEKVTKKTEDDKRTDSLIEAVKASKT